MGSLNVRIHLLDLQNVYLVKFTKLISDSEISPFLSACSACSEHPSE